MKPAAASLQTMPTTTPSKPIADTFERIEDKFLVPKIHQSDLKKLILQYLDASYVDANTQFTLIESLYFDSDNLDLFQHHFSKMDKRYKMRVRRYGPNGNWSNGVAFLEAKCKSNGICTKQRFMITQGDYQRLLTGGAIEFNAELLKVNPKTDPKKLRKRVEEINELITTFHLGPQVSLVYKRLAYERDNLRMTIDEDIQFTTFKPVSPRKASEIKHQDLWTLADAMGRRFSNREYMVVEVKHTGLIPTWFEEFIGKVGVSQTSFSKYCWGMANLIEEASSFLGGN